MSFKKDEMLILPAVDIKNDVQKSIIKTICSQIHRLLFISVAKIIALNINSFGDSVLM